MLSTSENPNVMNGCGGVRCCAVEIEACLPAGEFQNLHVAHVGSVDGQADGGAHLVKSVEAGCSRVDGQQLIDRVELDFEDV